MGIKDAIRQQVMSGIDMTEKLEDWEVERLIDNCILDEGRRTYIPLKEKMSIKKELFNSLRRWDVLTEYIQDEDITEIMVNGCDSIFVEKKGRIYKTDAHFEDSERLNSIIQQIVADCNRRVNDREPIVDARLKDGTRVNIVVPPVALDGAILTLRRFPKEKIGIKKLLELGSIDDTLTKVMEILVKARYNIFISGGTGSGKTTFLNALSDFIPTDERIITIEDSAELQLHNLPNLVRLEARTENLEGKNAISIRDLIKTSLRMRPDRIIVGEVRDAAAIDMLAAMNTGHDGSISTGHSNSAADMLGRLETMVLMGMDIPLKAVKQLIASGLDIIVHLGRLRDGSRKVLSISEVIGMKENDIELSTLFEFVETEGREGRIYGRFAKINDLMHVNKLEAWGMLDIYKEVLNGT